MAQPHCLDPFAPLRRGPAYAETPLVVSVPHAGRYYPDALAEMRAVPQRVIEQLEDRHVDRLIGAAVAAGAVAIVSPVARAWIDLNRAPHGGQEGRHARAGLGLVPTRLGKESLWRHGPSPVETEARIAAVHRPYHDAIAEALDGAAARHGHALLIDCHSMPPIRRGPGLGATLVIGDRHGQSAERAIGIAVASEAVERGLKVSRNAPYPGAYTVEWHGRPRARRNAIQLEFDRSLYLDPDLREPGAGMGAMVEIFARLCRAALAAAEQPPLMEAAE